MDDESNLKLLISHIKKIQYKIVFPIHPRTKSNIKKYNLEIPSNVILIEPIGYLDFLSLLLNCKMVLTDSGGIQEGAIILRKPCITLRHTSARRETILLKANVLFPPDRKENINNIIEKMINKKIEKNPYCENVAEKTMTIFEDVLKQSIF